MTFSLSELSVSKDRASGSLKVDVSVVIKNNGAVTGSEVVQITISDPDKGITHPKMQRGFTKAKDLKPGESHKVQVVLDKCAVSYWDSFSESSTIMSKGVWKVDGGEYGVHVGFECNKVKLEGKITINEDESFVWSGL
ncbi:hypothetical protein PQX77_021220 [Marasmius sp. AFHP31]|nr:hypothetical protein PQX77_021220 [Marasmius sp. AFHP31]